VTTRGQAVRDAETLRRIRALAIPPAWTRVWICPTATGHIQAVGRDVRGRKQYRYHARWRAIREETKYNRLVEFGRTLPRIRRRVQRDLAKLGLPRERVLATAVRLLERTLIRVGNTEYARHNGSFGLTTLRAKHVRIEGPRLRFVFRGKGGKSHTVNVTDRRLARIVLQCQDLPGHELFQYLDDTGRRQTIDSADVNAYLREIAGREFTAKDFRTWAGTVLAANALAVMAEKGVRPRKRQVAHAIEMVAGRLGNTPSICRKCYVHPAIPAAFLESSLLSSLKPSWHLRTPRDPALRRGEQAVLRFLERGMKAVNQ
jgi:DNA topoisomerase-1